MPDEQGTFTKLVNAMGGLAASGSGGQGPGIDDAAFKRLYDDLRRLASAALARESDQGPFQTTALVHEVLLRLGQFGERQEWQSRAHFFGAAARAMRQILVDEARRRRAEGRILKMLSEASAGASREIEVGQLDLALSALEEEDPYLCQIVMLRVFAGLTVAEIAEQLDRSARTIQRDWHIARAWLLRWLIDSGLEPPGQGDSGQG